jgi:hypothetical protein
MAVLFPPNLSRGCFLFIGGMEQPVYHPAVRAKPTGVGRKYVALPGTPSARVLAI